jgi:hypothetical protein
MERGVMDTPPPRKRGRPPKNAKLGNYPASTGSQSNSRTDVAPVTKPDAAMVNHNNNNSSNSNSRKADAKEGDDLEMIEGGTIPPSRPGQRGRPKKSLMAKKGEPDGKASGSSISDRELLKSELQDEELPVERTPEKPATRRSKKPSQVRSLHMEFFSFKHFVQVVSHVEEFKSIWICQKTHRSFFSQDVSDQYRNSFSYQIASVSKAGPLGFGIVSSFISVSDIYICEIFICSIKSHLSVSS